MRVAMLTFDEENPNSILSCLKAARENARSIREIISSVVWEELNKFYLLVQDAVATTVRRPTMLRSFSTTSNGTAN